MSSLPYLILHIGLPNTGTTYLQRDVFPRIPSIRFINRPRGDVLTRIGGPAYGLLNRCFSRSTVLWREYGDTVFACILGATRDSWHPDTTVLISDEGISTAARRPELVRMHLQEMQKKTAHWGFAGLRVICTVRRQDQWLGSHYAQLSSRLRGASQRSFESFVADFIDERTGYYHEGIILDYATLFEQLSDGVGSHNVLMLPYERMNQNWPGFLEPLLSFITGRSSGGTDFGSIGDPAPARHNARSSAPDNWALRDLAGTQRVRLRPARLFRRAGLPDRLSVGLPDLRRGKSICMTEALRARVLSRYAASNRAFARDAVLELQEFGYFIR